MTNEKLSSDDLRQAVETVLLENLHEQRRSRRWNIFFRLSIFVYIGFLTILFLSSDISESPKLISKSKHVAIVDLEGQISHKTRASADKISASLKNAFENKDSVAVVLRVNSPGGSPVQSRILFDKILNLQKKHDKELIAVIEDLGASGAYLVSSAASKIVADQTSLIGSIGVIMMGFGVEKAMNQIGVESRIMTAGKDKAMMNPFLPVTDTQKAIVQTSLEQIHKEFIENVRVGRKSKIKDFQSISSGRVFTGVESIKHGLIDELGNLESVNEILFKKHNIKDVVNYSPKKSFIEQLSAQSSEVMANIVPLLRLS